MFETLKSEAASKRKTKLMRTVIKRDVNSGHEESLSKLIDAVHNSYSGLRDKDLAQYGEMIREGKNHTLRYLVLKPILYKPCLAFLTFVRNFSSSLKD
jgi:hypothetical protein